MLNLSYYSYILYYIYNLIIIIIISNHKNYPRYSIFNLLVTFTAYMQIDENQSSAQTFTRPIRSCPEKSAHAIQLLIKSTHFFGTKFGCIRK